MRLLLLLACLAPIPAQSLPPDWKKAHDAQDRAALDRIAADAQAKAKDTDAASLYRAALAQHLRAEVAMEQRDKRASAGAAEAGIELARRAVAAQPKNGEYHRLLGTLCGQVIPANVLLGMQYGKCALEEVEEAVKLSPKSGAAWLSRGVGNYYLPANFGGGADKALADVEKALQLDAKSAESWLWKGIVLRKMNRNAEARQAFEKSLELNPSRAWAKQQLEKTPAQ
jgi:tetratricopeptide (TPR) repeat protein